MDCNVGKPVLFSEIFSEILKKKVILIYKTGKSKDVNKCRAMSIFPALAKIFEKLLFSRINQCN